MEKELELPILSMQTFMKNPCFSASPSAVETYIPYQGGKLDGRGMRARGKLTSTYILFCNLDF